MQKFVYLYPGHINIVMWISKEIKDLVKHWKKTRMNSSVKCTHELFKRVVEYYSTYHAAFNLDIGWSGPQRFSFIFEYPGLEPPMDTFEDLQVIRDLFRTWPIKCETTTLRGRQVFEGMFYKPGWALKHNEWFIEEMSDYKKFLFYGHFFKGKKPCKIEAECQFLYIERYLRLHRLDRTPPKFILKAIAKEERLWSNVEEQLLKVEKYGNFAVAFLILKGKPVKTVYEEDYKNVLAQIFRGDTARIKPLIDSHFESVSESWPKRVIDVIVGHIVRSLQYSDFKEKAYFKFLKELALQCPPKIFTKYFNAISLRPSDHVIGHIGELVDFDEMMVTQPKHFDWLIRHPSVTEVILENLAQVPRRHQE